MRSALAGALLALACAGPAPAPLVSVSDGRPLMGTILEITLVGPAGEVSRTDLDPLFAEASRLEAIFTRYDPTSALSRLNRAAGEGPQRVPPELARILGECVAWTRDTRGTFDVTVGPLVRLWTGAARRDRRPTPAMLSEARRAVGAEKLRIGADGRVELPGPNMAVNLDGVAKGWALDRLAERLRADGVSRALLDFGGSSVVALGTPPDAPGWRILLRGAEGGFAGTLSLRDRALSVSGSLGEWSTIEGRRHGHVIDPRSGEPMMRAFQAAIVAPTGGEAEAWSKALLVLGAKEGLALLESVPGVEGTLIDETGARSATSGFARSGGFVGLR